MQKQLNPQEINQLVSDAGNGNSEALKNFFEIYSEDIYNFPIRVFHLSEDDASDFYIYAFERLKSGRRLQSFGGKSSFKTWFYSVLRNLLIDWKRTIKEVKIQSITRTNVDGKEYNTIEDESDPLLPEKEKALEISEQFLENLSEIKIESRAIFKLSYIFYLQLEKDEVEYILDKTKINLLELKNWILETRSSLSNKEEDINKLEDKITSIYLSILELKEQQITEPIEDSKSNLPIVDKIGASLQKKYEQRRKLIERKQKGHFLSRTPYKEVAQLLGISEGGVSVTLIRVVEKLQKKIKFDEFS
ncbi:MAG: RNA polymerase sigma factor [Leptospira sp.]|nr:RNA polymerase sigma factor [Leptospira sp.]NCS92811.1 RNA polymerase sigma factor [Leptospira sp.]